MRAAIDWSHNLIPPIEQAYFRRLAVFDRGFPLRAAAVIEPTSDLDGDDASPALLVGISNLVDKNLLQRESDDGLSPRFTMLETVREFALERFSRDPEESTVRERHARWFLTFAEQTEARWQVPGGGSISEFLPEYDNLRAALSWFEERSDAESMLRLAAALGSFWMHMGHLREGLNWLERAVDLGLRNNAPIDRVSMGLSWRGVLATAAGDMEGARTLLERALELRRETDSWEGIAHTLRHLGLLSISSGDLATAEDRLKESEELFRLHRHDSGHSMVLDLMAEIAYIRRDIDTAALYSKEAVTVARRSGNRMRIALALVGSAQVAVVQCQPERAVISLREAGTLARDVGFPFGVADVLACVASIVGPRGEPVRAVRLLAAATAIRESLSLDHYCHHEQYSRALNASHDWLDAETYRSAWERGSSMNPEEAFAEAWSDMEPVSEPAPSGTTAELSPREREVLALLAQGHSNPEIADSLSISRKTVAVHVSHILNRLGVDSRAAAVAVAIRAHLV
jgi:non-specific serine/threonine protein kinase